MTSFVYTEAIKQTTTATKNSQTQKTNLWLPKEQGKGGIN